MNLNMQKRRSDIEVEQYLLKPVNAEELDKVFSRIRETLDHERDEQRNIDKAESVLYGKPACFCRRAFTPP